MVEVLGASSPGGHGLLFDGETLTAERLTTRSSDVLREHGAEGEPPLVGNGPTGANVHERGHGPIRPHESVIVDIFPRHTTSRYHADMTRTFCFGEAPEQLRHMHGDVYDALRVSEERIAAGVNGKAVWEAACDAIEAGGYRTTRGLADGETLDEDFFHGLGHGVGVEVHEAPNLGLVRRRPARRRRRHDRARRLSQGLRRHAPGGHRRRARGRLRGADELPVRRSKSTP